MKKAIAIMCFSSGTGGMERSAIRLAAIMSGYADRVVLLCKQGSFVEGLYRQGNHAFLCEPVSFSSRIFSPSMLMRVRQVISKYQIKNVVFLGASELKTLYFSFLDFDINLVVWHGTTKSKPKRDFFHRLVYSRVNYHVALSGHLLRNVETIVPRVGNAAYKVIMPSVDVKIRAQIECREEKGVINIVHIGRIAPGKGQIDALMACRILKDNGVSFRMRFLGESDNDAYLQKVKKLVRQNALDDCVFFPGNVNNVAEYLDKADIFLFPSSGEGMPAAFMEALHFKVICIVYDNTVFPEFRDMGFVFEMVRSGDVKALSAKLLEVASNMDVMKKAVSDNPLMANKYFCPQHEIDAWLEVLV